MFVRRSQTHGRAQQGVDIAFLQQLAPHGLAGAPPRIALAFDIPLIDVFCRQRNMEKNETAREPRRTVDVVRDALDLLTARLPASWSSRVREDASLGDRRVNAVVDLTAPDGQRASLVVVAKRRLEARDVAGLAQQLEKLVAAAEESTPTPLIVSRYLTPAIRDRLASARIGYADATGNLRLSIDRPALFLRDVGADRDPWRGPGRPRGSLRGATALRLVRALADFAPPYSVPRLAELSGTSIGATYRMVDFLEREDLITRLPRSPITDVDWRRLIERWGKEIGTSGTEAMTLCLAPRGLPDLVSRLQTTGIATGGLDAAGPRRVLTGSLAANYYDQQVPARLGVIYADPVDPLIEHLGLRPSPSGNVLIGPPIDEVVFDRTRGGLLRVAAASQVAMDLTGGPGRGPSEASLLLDWMERSRDAWRR